MLPFPFSQCLNYFFFPPFEALDFGDLPAFPSTDFFAVALGAFFALLEFAMTLDIG